MKLRAVFAVVALFLVGCHGSVDRATCEGSAKAAKWDMSATLASGPSESCPKISATFALPGACTIGCSCVDSSVTFEAASGAQTEDRCYLRYQQNCFDGSALDCRDTQLDSANHASGSCYYSGPNKLSCTYSVDWTRQD